MLKPVLIEGWECWDGSEGKHQYKHVLVKSDEDAHAAALEFVFTLLDPYKNDIEHYAEYRAKNYGDDPMNVIHETMLECAHYNLWERAC